MKNIIINILIITLCAVAVIINFYFDDYKVIGSGCAILMGVISLFKKPRK